MWRKGSLSQSYISVLSTVIVTNTSFDRITIRTSQFLMRDISREYHKRRGVISTSFDRSIWCLTCETILIHSQYKERCLPIYKKQTTVGWWCDVMTSPLMLLPTNRRTSGRRRDTAHKKEETTEREMSWCDLERGERPWHQSGRGTRNLTQLLNPIFHSMPSTARHCIDKLCSVEEMATNYTQSKRRTKGQELIYSRPYRTISCLWKVFICCLFGWNVFRKLPFSLFDGFFDTFGNRQVSLFSDKYCHERDIVWQREFDRRCWV